MSKKTLTITNVKPNQLIPLPPGAVLGKPVFNASGYATITVEYEEPKQRVFWHHEPGNCTLHLSRPFIRRPIVSSMNFGASINIAYCVVFGLMVGSSTGFITLVMMALLGHPPHGHIPWMPYLFIGCGLAYTAWYRYKLRRGIAQAYRDRILQNAKLDY